MAVKKTVKKVAAKKAVSPIEVLKSFKFSKSAVKMTPEMAKEGILELRSEMTHYVTESVSVSILALLLFIGAPSVFPEVINPYLPSSLLIMQSFVAVPTVFWILTILGNMVRYFKILKLKDSLK